MNASFAIVLLNVFLFIADVNQLHLVKLYTIADGLPHNEIRSLHMVDGMLWIGTPSGAAILENGKIKVDKIVKGGVPSILKDSNNRVWLGGIGQLHLYEKSSYQKFSLSEDLGLEARVVFSIYEDNDEKVWIATTGGSRSFYNSKWEDKITKDTGINNQVIHDVIQDEKGRYWFATRKGGLNILDKKAWKHLLPDKNCRKFLKDRSGNIWIGTNSGIVKYDDDNYRSYEEGRTVLPMFEGADGQIWCVTGTNEIVKLAADGSSVIYKDISAGQASTIYTLTRDDQYIYAGSDVGLIVLEYEE